jgi:PadR family transcriptional regulator, regulatory protein PadR
MEPLARITPATIDVLSVLLTDGLCWGLRVIKESGRPAGSVYPILERLESIGWVESSWEDDTDRQGPRRRYYELTEGGLPAARATVAAFIAKRNEAAAMLKPVIS